VLKLLQKSYYGKVKMIYIDPPYNTGKEFIYPDKYSESLETYLAYAGLVDDEGKKFATNTAAEGRFHTKWLNMMYPRLYLARNLLREDGFLLVSIDDAEITRAIELLNDILGEENHLATLVWDRNRKNDAKFFSVGHEYMIVWAKNKQLLKENKTVLRAPKVGIEEVKAFYIELVKTYKNDWKIIGRKLKDLYRSWSKDDPRKPLSRYNKVDEKGPYRDDGNINWPGGGGPTYEVLHPITQRPCKIPVSGWRYPTKERMQEEIESNRVVFGPDETTVPRVRLNMFESDGQVLSSVNYSYAQTAANEFMNIFDGNRIFENPKNFKDIRKLIRYLTNAQDYVLDFFAGSSTTAHAVLDLNREDNGNRKFIMVQLPEPCDVNSEAYKSGYETIADIGKERIRRVIAKIKEEQEAKEENGEAGLFDGQEEKPELDLGFKVLKLDRSNFKIWDSPDPEASEEDIKEQLELYVDHIDPKASQEDILFELLLKSGYKPTEKAVTKELAGKNVFSIAEGALLVCLEEEITRELIDAVAEAEPKRFICLDKGFKGNDQLKANAVQTFAARNQDRDKAEQIVFRTI
jgi:adenine-specific DNA-methyltransferase